MQADRLKTLVQSGNYRPQPAQIAEAMLRRRGVRELLTDEDELVGEPIGRIPQAEEPDPRAAA